MQTQTQLLNLSNHKTLNSHLVVVPVDIKEPGITSRAVQFEDRPEIGLVVSVADNITGINEGDIIFFGKYSTVQITYDGTQYLILREEDVYCVANTN